MASSTLPRPDLPEHLLGLLQINFPGCLWWDRVVMQLWNRKEDV